MAALIIEDGSGVTNANSYVSVKDATKYAEARGVMTEFANSDDVQVWLVNAMDYLQAVIDYQGVTSYTDQSLLWPRWGLYIGGTLFDRFTIPKQLKDAQCQLAMIQAQGVSLYVNWQGTELQLKRKKVDVLEREWFEPGANFGYTSFPFVDALLNILRSNGTGLRTLRV